MQTPDTDPNTIPVPRERLADVLFALVSQARPVGLGWANHGTFTRADATALVEQRGERQTYDYVNGCPIKVYWRDGNLYRADLYDRDQGGPGSCARIVAGVLGGAS